MTGCAKRGQVEGASAVHGDIYRFVLDTHIPSWPGQAFTVYRLRSHWRRARSAKLWCLSAPHYRLKFGPHVWMGGGRPIPRLSLHCDERVRQSVCEVCVYGSFSWKLSGPKEGAAFPNDIKIKLFLNYRYISDVMCLEKWGKCHNRWMHHFFFCSVSLFW